MPLFGSGKKPDVSTLEDNPALVTFVNRKTGALLGATLNQVETFDSLEIPFFFPKGPEEVRKLREHYREETMPPIGAYAVRSGFANAKATGIKLVVGGEPIDFDKIQTALGLPSVRSKDFSVVPHFEQEALMQVVLIEIMRRASPLQDRSDQRKVNESFANSLKEAYWPWEIVFEPLTPQG